VIDQIMKLGKLLIKENKVNDYDMLNQWMLNYIAEKMIEYENAETVVEKNDSARLCMDAILTFWKSRHVNSSINPFEDFKELYDAIRKLNSSNEVTIFSDFFDDYNIDKEDLANKIKMIRRCTNALLKNILYNHVDDIFDDELLEWIGVTKEIENNEDSIIIDDILREYVTQDYFETIDKKIQEFELVGKMYCDLAEEYKSQRNIIGC